MRVLWRVIVKEFLQIRRDRKMIPVMIVAPVVQITVFGFAVNTDVRDVPTVLVDQARSATSRDLVSRFERSGYFEVVGTEETAGAVDRWLVTSRAQMGLVIAPGFGAAVAAGRTASLQIVADGTDAASSNVAIGYAGSLANEYGASLAERFLRAPGAPRLGQLALVPRVFYNPDLKSRWFYVPAVLAMVLMLVTMMLPSMAVVREKEIGTLEQISVTPLRPWQLILGKLVPFVVIGLLDTLLITGLARLVFGVPLNGSLVTLLALTLLYILNTLGLGLLVSTLVSNQQQAMMASAFVLMVPMIYISGLIFPIENMPAVFQWASLATPVRYYGNVVRGVFLRGAGWDVLWTDGAALLGMGVVILTLASLRFRKSLD